MASTVKLRTRRIEMWLASGVFSLLSVLSRTSKLEGRAHREKTGHLVAEEESTRQPFNVRLGHKFRSRKEKLCETMVVMSRISGSGKRKVQSLEANKVDSWGSAKLSVADHRSVLASTVIVVHLACFGARFGSGKGLPMLRLVD